MSASELAVAAAGLFIAGLVKGATGVGYSTTALPIIALGLGLDRAMPLVLLPSMASNVTVMLGAGEFRSTFHRFRWLYVALLPGLAAGLALLGSIPPSTAARVLGCVIVAYAIYALWRTPLTLSASAERRLNVPVGLLNGFINGLTGSQILPSVPYALSLGLSSDGVVQLTNVVFTLSSLVMLFGLSRIGYLDATTFLLSAAGLLPALAGVKIGAQLRRRIPVETFRRLVLATLAVLGVLLGLPRM